MSKTSKFSCAVAVCGDGIVGDTWIPPQSPLSNPNAPGGVPSPSVALSAGLNTIAVPSGSIYALVSAGVTSANVKNLKTTSGDIGIPITNQMVLIPVTGLTSIYCQSVGSDSITIAWF